MTFTSELKLLRERYGVRCGTCEFFRESSCGLIMDFKTPNDWCESWNKVKPPEPPEKPPCKGFHWLGQSMDHCDMCGKDISLHEGLSWNNSSKLFGEKEERIIPFDEARKRIPMFAHYVTPIGHPEGPYRYEHPAEYFIADAP